MVKEEEKLLRNICLLEQVQEFQFYENQHDFYDPTHKNKNEDKKPPISLPLLCHVCGYALCGQAYSV